jgi:hypothetical protein
MKVSESHVNTLRASATSIEELGLEHMVEQERFSDALLTDLGDNEESDVSSIGLPLKHLHVVRHQNSQLGVMDSDVLSIDELNGLSLRYVPTESLPEFHQEHVVGLHLVHELGVSQLLLSGDSLLVTIKATNVSHVIV